MKKKILSVVGARPNFIKLAALHPILETSFNHVIVHTGQHYDYGLSQNFFVELKLPVPNYNLEVGSYPRGKQVSLIREKSTEVLKIEKPDIVIVYGDTNSTLGGALAASKLGIKIAHIEAGIRSYEKSLPEEINRVEADRLSSILFCPSQIATKNLEKEGINKNVYFTGDVMYDIFLKTKSEKAILEKLGLKNHNYYFSTIHRQVNTDRRINLESILIALGKLDKVVIMPVHPRTEKAVAGYKIKTRNIRFIKPVNFSQNIALESNAKTIITDSGGIQKEAYWLKVPAITLRDSTEWPETVSSGWNKLVGANKNLIAREIKDFKKPDKHPNYYGKGDASLNVSQILQSYL